jgi:hypothetical protein
MQASKRSACNARLQSQQDACPELRRARSPLHWQVDCNLFPSQVKSAPLDFVSKLQNVILHNLPGRHEMTLRRPLFFPVGSADDGVYASWERSTSTVADLVGARRGTAKLPQTGLHWRFFTARDFEVDTKHGESSCIVALVFCCHGRCSSICCELTTKKMPSGEVL